MRLPDFSAGHIARQKEGTLAAQFKEWRTRDPDKSAAELIAKAKETLTHNGCRRGGAGIRLSTAADRFDVKPIKDMI